MEPAARIEIPYEGNTADHLDLALGIMAHSRSIRKGKKWKDLRYSAIVRRTFVRAGVFAALCAVLAAMMLYNLAAGLRIAHYHTVVLTLETGYTAFLLWSAVTMRSHLKGLLRGYAQPHPGGRLVFEDYGIEDACQDGRSMRLPWAEYALCVITPEVIVLGMGHAMYFMPARQETAAQVSDALAQRGRADTVIDLRGP